MMDEERAPVPMPAFVAAVKSRTGHARTEGVCELWSAGRTASSLSSIKTLRPGRLAPCSDCQAKSGRESRDWETARSIYGLDGSRLIYKELSACVCTPCARCEETHFQTRGLVCTRRKGRDSGRAVIERGQRSRNQLTPAAAVADFAQPIRWRADSAFQ